MLQTPSLLDPVQMTMVGDQPFIPVPWSSAEGLQSHLRRQGIRSTIHLDPAEHAARLEVWPGSDPAAVQAALSQWQG